MDILKIEIMKMLYEGRPTIPEMSNYIDKAFATVHKMLWELIKAGLVDPPRAKGAARDYHISPAGIAYLKENKYISNNTGEQT